MPSSKQIVLTVQHQGHVPSMKNTKMLTRGRLITKPERQKWMEKCIQDFVCQLNCALATIDGGTWTEQQQRCSIASRAPLDDSRQWIPELHVTVKEVPAGEEGAVVTIERLE